MREVFFISASKSIDCEIFELLERNLGKKIPIVSYPSTLLNGYRVQNGKITELSLSNQDLIQIPDEVWNLKHLKALFLEGNKIVEISSKIKKLENLEILYLDNNLITEIPLEISNLSHLKILSMVQNHIGEFPLEIERLHQLKALLLAKNNFTIAPNPIWSLSNLEVLNMAGNHLMDLPSLIQNLQKLTIFNIGNNNIAGLPMEIDKLHAIRNLCLKGNPLEISPFTLNPLSNLRMLDLGEVLITNHVLIQNIARKAKTDCLVRWNLLKDPLNEVKLSNASKNGPWRVKKIGSWADIINGIFEFKEYPATLLILDSRATHQLSFGINGPWSFVEAQTTDGGAVTRPIYDTGSIKETTIEYDVAGVPTPVTRPYLIPIKITYQVVEEYYSRAQLSTKIEWED